jgi:6-phosphogluconolactonase (cycloisomerase 2 family)
MVRPSQSPRVQGAKPAGHAAALDDYGRENCMKRVSRISLLVVVAASAMTLAACGQKSNCSGITFGGSGSGTGSGGGVNSGGSVCGAGSNNSGGPVSDYVYYMQGNTLIGAGLAGGSLAPLPGFVSPNLGLGTAADMTIVSKKFLYEPWIPSGGVVGIQGFVIDRNTGAITPVPGNPIAPTVPAIDSIAADPQGRFLYVGDHSTATIDAFQVDSTTGALTPTSFSPFPLSGGASLSVLTVDGTGKYLYASDTKSGFGSVYGFTIDQFSGDLTPIAGSPWALDLFFVQADPTGKYLMGTDAFGGITVVTIQQGTGILQTATSFATTNPPYALAIHPNGNFVYTFALDNKIHPLAVEGYQIDSTGNLTALAGSPFTTLPGMFGGKFDQDGTGLFALNTTGGVQVFVVDPATGAMTANIAPIATVATYFAPTN